MSGRVVERLLAIVAGGASVTVSVTAEVCDELVGGVVVIILEALPPQPPNTRTIAAIPTHVMSLALLLRFIARFMTRSV